MRTIAIIGGGAAGLMAAAAAAESADCRILLFDCNDRLGRKIYATGNGRCNLTNYEVTDACYNQPVLDRIAVFESEALMSFYEERGVFLHDRGGYVYPRTDQAATIVDCLERSLRVRGNVEVHLSTLVTGIAREGEHYVVTAGEDAYSADRVILAAGSPAGVSNGNGRMGYILADALGHFVTRLAPALVPVQVEDPLLKVADGVRCKARVTAVVDGERKAVDTGEVQITKTGFSGIPVFQVSRHLSLALAQGQQAEILVNFLPEFSDHDLEAEIRRRQQDASLVYVSDITAGLVHTKVGSYMARCLSLADEKKLCKIENRDEIIRQLLTRLRSCTYPVTGTAGYDKAQVTAGGIPLSEITETFESCMTPGLYLAGELLDVDGMCGGYNLTWAMCSGHIAGMHAAQDTISQAAS